MTKQEREREREKQAYRCTGRLAWPRLLSPILCHTHLRTHLYIHMHFQRTLPPLPPHFLSFPVVNLETWINRYHHNLKKVQQATLVAFMCTSNDTQHASFTLRLVLNASKLFNVLLVWWPIFASTSQLWFDAHFQAINDYLTVANC